MEESRKILRNKPKYLYIFPQKMCSNDLGIYEKTSFALDAKTTFATTS